ncbi:hypothetical protein [Peterkaempfera sp. SMS 1(5)a]|uniref:hypothetical protein n=1 Tax=Peterkaempfera podocarpi TaxID=3232308 RepID=UPI00366DBBAF
MPRGRHRQSSTLGRILPVLAVAVLTIAAGALVLLDDDTVVTRAVGLFAVAAACAGVLLLRRRDRAGELAMDAAAIARQRAEERHEEQLAELEYAVEVAEERVSRLGRRLAVEKSRLARAETENARLLRERAVAAAGQAVKDAEAARRRTAEQPARHPVTPTAYVRAAAVLRTLERRAAVEHAQRVAAQVNAESARRRAAEAAEAAGRTVPALPAARPQAPVEHTPSTPATAIVPLERQRPRPVVVARSAGFSFFDRTTAGGLPTVPSQAVGDLSDVVGDEAVAAQARYTGGDAGAQSPEPLQPAPAAARAAEPQQAEDGPAVVDLTEHDETERMDLRALRAVQ